MKSNRIKMLVVLVFASLALSSCSVEYRQRHARDRHDGRDHHDYRGNDGYHYKAI